MLRKIGCLILLIVTLCTAILPMMILPIAAEASQTFSYKIYDRTILGVYDENTPYLDLSSPGVFADYDVVIYPLELGKTYYLTTGSSTTDQRLGEYSGFRVLEGGVYGDVLKFGQCITAGSNTTLEAPGGTDPHRLYEVNEFLKYTNYNNSTAKEDLTYFELDLDSMVSSGTTSFVHVLYLFEAYYDITSAYGVYFYVYVPNDKKITFAGIDIATVSSPEDSDYVRYVLRSVGNPYQNVWKFRVENPSGLHAQVSGSGENDRIYSYRNLTVNYKDSTVAYDNSGSFTVTGSDFGTGNNAKSVTSTDDRYSVKLDIGYTFYRTDTSPEGAYHHNQIDSIYFSLPAYLEEQLGNLYDVELTYQRVRTKPVFVVSDYGIYNSLSSVLHRRVTSFDSSLPSLCSDLRRFDPNHYAPWAGFNVPGYLQGYHGYGFTSYEPIDWLFRVKNIEAGIRHVDSTVPSDDLWSFAAAYSEDVIRSIYGPVQVIQGANGSKYVTDLFEEIDERVTINSSTLDLNAENYAEGHNFFERWAEYGFGYALGGSSTDVSIDLTGKIIQTIPSLSAIEEGSDVYYFSETDKSKLKSVFDGSGGNSLKIVHFAVSDCFQMMLHPLKSWMGSYVVDEDSVNGYVTQEDMYLDLYVISLSFKDGFGTVTNVKAKSTHIDAAAALMIEPSSDDVNRQAWSELLGTDDDGREWLSELLKVLAIVFGAIAILLVVLVAVKVVSPVFSLISTARLSRKIDKASENKNPPDRNDRR